jgi:hypothetical protein
MRRLLVSAILFSTTCIIPASSEVVFRATSSIVEPAKVVPKVAVLVATPPQISGMDIVAGVSSSQSFQLSNTGNAPATGLALSAGDPFAILSTDCGSSLPASTSCSVTVGLLPSKVTSNGSLSGSFAVAGSSLAVGLEGTASGYAPVLSTPGSLAVAAITTGAATGDCTSLVVSNTGTVAGLSGASVSFSGANAANFQTCAPATNPCTAATVAAGGSCNLGVQTKSTVDGNFTATATVSTSSPGTKTVALTSSATGYLQACVSALGTLCADGSYHSAYQSGGSTNSDGKIVDYAARFYIAADTNQTLTFADARAACESLVAHGYDDWHLTLGTYSFNGNATSALKKSLTLNTGYWMDSLKAGANFPFSQWSSTTSSYGDYAAGTLQKKFRCMRAVGTYTVAP